MFGIDWSIKLAERGLAMTRESPLLCVEKMLSSTGDEMLEKTGVIVRHGPTNRWAFFNHVLGDRTIGMMEALDGLGYFTTGLSFLAIGMVLFVRAWYVFVTGVGSDAVLAVLGLVHDLLLVIILLELFRTTINFLKTKVITLEPFLYICVIASTRRILTTGAQVSYMNDLTDLVFNRYLMDLGANVLVVMILIIAVYLTRRTAPQPMNEGAGSAHRTDSQDEREQSWLRGSGGRVIRLQKESA